jgi:cystathionine beta-lyase/cystathionine gamma-synthase
MSGKLQRKYGFETSTIHAGNKPDKAYGAISFPIYQTSNFAFSDFGKTKGYDYTRSGNPTRRVLEDTIARLEGGNAGFAFSSGMSAITTVIHLLKAGDHVICGNDIYGGTYRLFENVMKNFGIQFTFIRLNDKKQIEKVIRPETKLIWLESPSNPLLNIIDLELIVDIARKHKLLTVIDNTFASPFFLKPIDFGIDIVVHSTTKYINGHCDVIGGAVVTTTVEITRKVQFLLNAMGTAASPFDCWLVLRGIETLALRVRQHEKNAFTVAEYLQGHSKVERVYFPGLPSHPGHEIAARQMTGFGGIVSFEIKGGIDDVKGFLKRLKIFKIAESLGGPVSLAEHPASMSHASMSEKHRIKTGIKENLIRLSIGLETVEDLIKDLHKALK